MTTTPAAVAATVLRPPRHRVERRAIAWWTTRTLLVAVPAAAAPAAAAAVVPEFAQPPATLVTALWLAAAALSTAGLAVAGAMPLWRFRVHRWEVTDTAVYTAAGWLWQEWRVAPMSRIQTVDTHRGPLQRVFGLADVTVTTASAAGPITVEGLDSGQAEQVAAELTEATERTEGDAT
ncbi:PH domain-containing protein [Streptomonospora litoralis]|uniref:Bacterial membrane flanked domain protein n=1 Tax=Streptomonospora litoralis TaxID=2498135 RepID=A0A4P6Q5D4_9ACTN|nr:PH domain-containing protein [Streptomonospora litoralis]QBI54199.1 Bacterial membrane flanked domain protein [Streptomonospora litoralis]